MAPSDKPNRTEDLTGLLLGVSPSLDTAAQPNPDVPLAYQMLGVESVGPGNSVSMAGGKEVEISPQTPVESQKPSNLGVSHVPPGGAALYPGLLTEAVPEERKPPLMALPDVLAIVSRSDELADGQANFALPSGNEIGTAAISFGATTFHTVSITGPTIDPLEVVTAKRRGIGPFLGWGTSYDLVIGPDGRLDRVDVYGSDDISSVRIGEDNTITFIPKDVEKNPYTVDSNIFGIDPQAVSRLSIPLGATPGEVDLGYMGAAAIVGSHHEIRWTNWIKQIEASGGTVPPWASDIKWGKFPPINRAGSVGGLVTFIPAVIVDMHADGNTLPEALLREGLGAGSGILAGTAAGAATGALFGGPAGALVGAAVSVGTAFYVSKLTQQQILRSKGYLETWMLPEDPEMLRGYIDYLSSQDPAADFRQRLRDDPTVGVPTPEEMREIVAWQAMLDSARNKLEIIEGAERKAAGGLISGIGGPRDDLNLAWLSNGEFVVNAQATSKLRPLLELINAGWVPNADFLHEMLADSPDGRTIEEWSYKAPIASLEGLKDRYSERAAGILAEKDQPLKTLEMKLAGPSDAPESWQVPVQYPDLATQLEDTFGGADGVDPGIAASLAQSGLQGFLSGARGGGLVKGFTGGLAGLASATGGQIGSTIGAALGAAGGPVGTMVGSAIGSTVGSMVGQTASEFVTKPIEYVASTAKELVGGGFGLIDLANGAGADTAKGDIYNFNGMDPKSVSIAVERVNRRRTLAQQRGGGFGR
ncbi:hypothetical protein [Nocardia otitidiscaviarum]|uniref:hypothetical protein n=1 Tax=Nocardia otitidiscaviarum TaxID=1823 RepID=UPI002456D167|nr:hypothetical protein [Nocardia otitidiscaviarum]